MLEATQFGLVLKSNSSTPNRLSLVYQGWYIAEISLDEGTLILCEGLDDAISGLQTDFLGQILVKGERIDYSSALAELVDLRRRDPVQYDAQLGNRSFREAMRAVRGPMVTLNPGLGTEWPSASSPRSVGAKALPIVPTRGRLIRLESSNESREEAVPRKKRIRRKDRAFSNVNQTEGGVS